MPKQSTTLDRLDGPWRQRHRRLWIFCMVAPYVLIAPVLLLLALGDKVPDATVRVVVLSCLALFVVYAVAALVWGYRVYSSGWSKTRQG